MTATLRLKIEQLNKIRKWVGLETDSALAAEMGIDPGNLSRVLRGKQQPGPKFIAALCSALRAELADLFEVVDGEDQADGDTRATERTTASTGRTSGRDPRVQPSHARAS